MRFALLLVACLAAGTVEAADNGPKREAMAEAMSRMMEAMGFLGDNAPSGAMPDSMGSALPGAGGWPGLGTSSVMPSLGNPVPYYGMGEMMERFPQPPMPDASMAQPWLAGPLEGVWESPDGGLLIVQGSHYRLYQRCAGHIDGTLALSGDRLLLRNLTLGIEHGFDIALQDGRLALRGDDGQIFFYRRLQLGTYPQGP